MVRKSRKALEPKPLTALKQWMRERGMTQKQLAKFCEISEASMSRALKGTLPLSTDNVATVALMTGLPVALLMPNGPAKKTLELLVRRLRSRDGIAKDSGDVA